MGMKLWLCSMTKASDCCEYYCSIHWKCAKRVDFKYFTQTDTHNYEMMDMLICLTVVITSLCVSKYFPDAYLTCIQFVAYSYSVIHLYNSNITGKYNETNVSTTMSPQASFFISNL